MGDRIYCVCSDSTRLFVYHRQPPHNRIKPEEVNLENLTKPTDLAICEQKTSVFICNYTDDRTIYRLVGGRRVLWWFIEERGGGGGRKLIDGESG